MPKEKCKYWEKCYQKNEAHLQKYDHPVKDADVKTKMPKEEKLRPVVVEEVPNEVKGEAAASLEEIDTTELREETLKNIAGKNYFAVLQKRIKLSVQNEYDELLRSNEFIRHKFLVEMPDDFYKFWSFLNELQKDSSQDILMYIEKTFQLQLVGAFEFLAGRFHNAKIHEPGDYLRHWRFFYDPPEFQTIFVKRGTGIHYGYWRDVPSEKTALLVARNDAAKNCEFEFIAGNVFDAFLYFIEHDFNGNPFTANAVTNTTKALHKFIKNHDINLERLDTLQKARSMRVVTKTFHRAGIVVPYEKRTQLGYRPLPISDAELSKILKLFEMLRTEGEETCKKAYTAVMEKLQPVATAASIALDESDFGTSLELGIDLFCSGHIELHSLIQSLLVPAYKLLERPQFLAIVKAHMDQRRKHFNLSIFNLDKAV